MALMKHLLLLAAFSLSLRLGAQDTFSIVAVDPETGEVGSAGASCVPGAGSFGGVMLLSGIIPGRGGVNAQAYICLNPHINLNNAIARMQAGLSPDEVIAWLEQNDACGSQGFNPAYRQYGVVDLDEQGQARSAAYTGTQCDDWKGHRTGPTYAIQGNILSGPEVLEDMETAFLSTPGSLAARLMAAMQGAKRVGADSRCTAAGTSSTSAFLRVFKPDDEPGQPYLQLNVAETPSGQEPIDSLQALFNEWQLTGLRGSNFPQGPRFRAFPNPCQDWLKVEMRASMPGLQWQWFTLTGQRLHSEAATRQGQQLKLPKEAGAYFLCLTAPGGQVLQAERILALGR